MIKAIFFDIDGTLIPHGEKQMPSSTIDALNQLREKGIKLFIATGRPPNSISHIYDMFDFDGFLTANGQYCFTQDHVIFEKYIPKESIYAIIPYIEEKKLPVLFATLNKNYRNQYNVGDFDSIWPIVDLNTVKDEKMVQIMAYIDPKEDDAFIEHLPLCQSARWTDVFADIIPIDGGKDKGIDHILDDFGISLSQTMAFGDGANDITMLQHVPYGISMGNASQEVKDHAYYVTTDICDDGIYHALIHFGVLEK